MKEFTPDRETLKFIVPNHWPQSTPLDPDLKYLIYNPEASPAGLRCGFRKGFNFRHRI